jgi:hypothetical protein
MILSRVNAIWKKYPDMRLLQLLQSAVYGATTELYYLEDCRLMELLENFCECPEPSIAYRLEDLVSGITSENKHDLAETGFGEDVGQEVVDVESGGGRPFIPD